MTASRARTKLLLLLPLIAATAAVYWAVAGHDFVTYDDSAYVTENSIVQAGPTLDGIVWAFTTGATGNWHPLTWLSHMLDCRLFGLSPGPHHLVSLLLHILNVALLFLALSRLTGALYRPAFVAGLFALHPLHVESVAWVAERKDLLSTLFFLLALLAYARYSALPSLSRYLLVLTPFALGLLAKPMIVTLPFLLLLLDGWPLGRFDRGGRPLRLLLEKLPLLALSAASCAVTLVMQSRNQSVASLEAIPLLWRIGNALVSYALYAGKMFWPSGLCVLYPHPGAWPALAVGASALGLALLSALAFLGRRRMPWVAVGWYWYLGTLVPVIGLVQVGYQAMADRYTYIPLIGLFIVIAWGMPALLGSRRGAKAALAAAALGSLALLAILSARQLGYWHDSMSLYRRALAVTHDNSVMHYNLANALAARGELEAAIENYRAAIRIEPDFAEARVNLGNALRSQGKLEEAIRQYSAAVGLDPGLAVAHMDLGLALAQAGERERAIAAYQEAIRLDPGYAAAHRALGQAHAARGTLDLAIASLSEALKLDPSMLSARLLLAETLARAGRSEESIQEYSACALARPDDASTRADLARALAAQGRLAEAAGEYASAARLRPGDAAIEAALADVLAQQGRTGEAIPHFEEALRLEPGNAPLRFRYALVLALLARSPAAAGQYCEALRLRPALGTIPVLWEGPPLEDGQLEAALDELGRKCPPPARNRRD